MREAARPLPQEPAPVVIDAARNRRVAIGVTLVLGFMFGASFAAVPLYDLFCRTTGYGGTPQVADRAPETVGTREFSIRFDANVASGLAWRFEPEVSEVAIRVGEVKTVGYTLRNTRGEASTGIASFNVTPETTGAYFNKIACFCFTEQTLQPGEARTEDVVFFIDPAIVENKELAPLRTITLSYTFFPAKSAAKPLADAGRLGSPGEAPRQPGSN